MNGLATELRATCGAEPAILDVDDFEDSQFAIALRRWREESGGDPQACVARFQSAW